MGSNLSSKRLRHFSSEKSSNRDGSAKKFHQFSSPTRIADKTNNESVGAVKIRSCNSLNRVRNQQKFYANLEGEENSFDRKYDKNDVDGNEEEKSKKNSVDDDQSSRKLFSLISNKSNETKISVILLSFHSILA